VAVLPGPAAGVVRADRFIAWMKMNHRGAEAQR
jgi:hypothetical protein